MPILAFALATASTMAAAQLPICAPVAPAVAAPVTYTGFAVTDVRLAGTLYRMAQVFIKFVGDTGDVQPLPSGAPVQGCIIANGSASIKIVKGEVHINANFLPNQIVVSVDQTNGGVGFGSMLGGNLNPAYPLAFDGTDVLGFGDSNLPDLGTPGSWADHAWSCIGFPVSAGNGGNGTCTDPSGFPLHTDRGDLFIYQRYLGSLQNGLMTDDYKGSLNIGVFSIVPGAH